MFLKKKKMFLNAYTTGQCVPISEVKDEVFSQKMMGDGLAIYPILSEIFAPCDGTISAVFETTQHAVGITMDNGMELLIHVGLDTVNLKEGVLYCHVKNGQKIKQGDHLISYDKEVLTQLGYSDVTMCVILNEGNAKQVTILNNDQVEVNNSPIIQYT